MAQIATSRSFRIRRLTWRASVEPHPAQLLRLLLLPARDPRATPAERLRAYRSLLRVLDGRLGDPKFARALHFAWINLSSGNLGWSASTPIVGVGLWRPQADTRHRLARRRFSRRRLI